MLLFVPVIDVTTRYLLRRESERRLRLAADRFQAKIRDFDVIFRDVNGPRGGVDKRCLLRARLRRGGSVEVQAAGSTFSAAIGAAAKRLRRVLSRRFGGKIHRKYDQRSPFRRPWSVA
jgi:ribosome-associated translation inhibitor RaiA